MTNQPTLKPITALAACVLALTGAAGAPAAADDGPARSARMVADDARLRPAAAPTSLLEQPALVKAPSVSQLADLYGNEIIYDVYRKGDRIGEHTVEFRQVENGWKVINQLKIKVKVLFFTAYELDYASTSYWENDELQWVRARVDDNGEKLRMQGALEGAQFVWTCKDNKRYEVEAGGDYLPTNHWNTAILDEPKLLNTLTGHQIEISIASAGWETVETEQGPVLAEKMVYSGELTNRSWYDRDGRWISLAFEGKDGSTISYKCRKCGLAGVNNPRETAR